MTDETGRDESMRAFLGQLRRDQADGLDRPLGDYLRQFPGHDDSIARSYLRHRHRAAQEQDVTAIGPYITSSELGRGGQGIVFRATHSELGHDVALKILKGLGPGSGSIVERFYREAKVAARLNHPNICQVIDAGIEDGVPFMAMQFIEGETLARRLDRMRSKTSSLDETRHLDLEDSDVSVTFARPESPSSSLLRGEVDELLTIFEKAARALQAAHEAGVVHRDVKPANIMIRPDGEPVLLDFGLARSDDEDLDTLTATGEVFGTPAYMSPEQLSPDDCSIDGRTDVWSLGIALFECLAMQRPFHGPSRDALYRAIMTREAPPLRKLAPSVRRDLAIVVAKAIEKDRNRRYATAEEFADDLRCARTLQPIIARSIGPLTRSSRWAQRNPVVAGLLLVIILTLSIATALTTRAAGQARQALDSERIALAKMTAARNAESGALQAETQERIAKERALAEERAIRLEYTRLADTKLLANALARSDELWPISKDLEPKLLKWQDDFAKLLDPETISSHESALQRLRQNALPQLESDRQRDFAKELAEIEALTQKQSVLELDRRSGDDEQGEAARTRQLQETEARLGELRQTIKGRRTWRFDSNEDAFRHEILSRLVTDLRAFTASDGQGAQVSIADRLVRSRRIDQLTVTGETVARLWEETVQRVRVSASYRLTETEREKLGFTGAPTSLFTSTGEMTIGPQVGLIPLGPDPTTGLEEFLHLETHAHDWMDDDVELPKRRLITAEDTRGGFQLSSQTGVILVLIPAGVFRMGTQDGDPSGVNHDPRHVESEGPVHELALGAYFLSKYEMTQGQWARGAARAGSAATDPSRYGVGAFSHQVAILPSPVSALHPVEQVDWITCHELTRRLGLLMPTEAQWERAARAGNESQFWAGTSTPQKLRRIANISGQETAGPASSWQRTKEHVDRFVIHAPVATYHPNDFGLHDMTGNLWEWCRDRYSGYEVPAAPGNGLRDAPSSTRVSRGGSFTNPASLARVSERAFYASTFRDVNLGLRPSRSLEHD